MYLPVAHGEGKVVTNPGVMPQLKVALYYNDEHGNNRADYSHNLSGAR